MSGPDLLDAGGDRVDVLASRLFAQRHLTGARDLGVDRSPSPSSSCWVIELIVILFEGAAAGQERVNRRPEIRLGFGLLPLMLARPMEPDPSEGLGLLQKRYCED